jgi:hypothetical protein
MRKSHAAGEREPRDGRPAQIGEVDALDTGFRLGLPEARNESIVTVAAFLPRLAFRIQADRLLGHHERRYLGGAAARQFGVQRRLERLRDGHHNIHRGVFLLAAPLSLALLQPDRWPS